MSQVRPFSLGGTRALKGEQQLDVRSLYGVDDKHIEKTLVPYVYESRQGAYPLARAAASQLLTGLSRQEVDAIGAIVYVTQSPSRFLPSEACVLQDDLGLSEQCLAFDVGQGCTGFIQGLEVATGLLESHGNVLLVTADAYRQKLSRTDRSTGSLFSDGASATLVTPGTSHTVLGTAHLTRGSGRDFLSHGVGSHDVLQMSGRDVYLFTREVALPMLTRAASNAGIDVRDLTSIYIHQASGLVLDAIANQLMEFSFEIPVNLQLHGNTTSSTIPFLWSDGHLPRANTKSALLAFGVGLSASALVMETSGP